MKHILTLCFLVLSLAGANALQAQKNADAPVLDNQIQLLMQRRADGLINEAQFNRQLEKLKAHHAQAVPQTNKSTAVAETPPATVAERKRVLVADFEAGRITEAQFRQAVAELREGASANTAAPAPKAADDKPAVKRK